MLQFYINAGRGREIFVQLEDEREIRILIQLMRELIREKGAD